jgi:hypothetical protein
MKKIFVIATVLIVTAFFVSCVNKGSHDDETDGSSYGSPPVNPAFDNTNEGVYKGVIVGDDAGSSGSFEVNAQSDTSATLTQTISNIKASYNGSGTQSSGNYTYSFTTGSSTFIIIVTSTGQIINVNTTDPNLAGASIQAYKETSTKTTRCFEGTFSGSYSGVWNFVISGSSLSGSASGAGTLTGTVSGSSVNITFSAWGSPGTATGTISGSSASGTWTISSSGSGTWSGSETY